MSHNLVQVSFSTHRVIKFLDGIYEFGPTIYYQSISDIDDGLKLFDAVISQLCNDQLNTALRRIETLANKKRITIKPFELKVIAQATDQEWSTLKNDYQNMAGRKIAINESIVLMITDQLKERYEGSQACIGDEFNFDELAIKISEDLIGQGDVRALIAHRLLESGCFAVVVYDKHTKDRWDPMEVSFKEFVSTHSAISAYVDYESAKSFDDIFNWINCLQA